MENLARYQKSNIIRANPEEMREYIARKVEIYINTAIVVPTNIVIPWTDADGNPIKIRIQYSKAHRLSHCISPLSRTGRYHMSVYDSFNNTISITRNVRQGTISIKLIQRNNFDGSQKPDVITDDERRIRIMQEDEFTTRDCDKILAAISPHILAPITITPRRNVSNSEVLSWAARKVAHEIMFGEVPHPEVIFFPENYPDGGWPITLSRESIFTFCHDHFLDEPRGWIVMDGIEMVTDAVVELVETTLITPSLCSIDLRSPWIHNPGSHKSRLGILQELIDRASVDEVKVYVKILRYLGVEWV